MKHDESSLEIKKESIEKKHRLLWKKINNKFSKALKNGDEGELKSLKLSSEVLINIMKGEKLAWDISTSAEGASIDELFRYAKRMEQTFINK